MQLVEIFGGTGAVLAGIICGVWKIVTTYEFKIVENEYFDNKPIKTLWNNWEELNDGIKDAQHCHNRRQLAVTEGEKIRVNMKNSECYTFVYLETRNENIRPELNEQYKEIDDKLNDAKRGYEYLLLLEKWLDKKVKPNKNFYKNMRIYDALKRSVM